MNDVEKAIYLGGTQHCITLQHQGITCDTQETFDHYTNSMETGIILETSRLPQEVKIKCLPRRHSFKIGLWT